MNYASVSDRQKFLVSQLSAFDADHYIVIVKPNAALRRKGKTDSQSTISLANLASNPLGTLWKTSCSQGFGIA